MDEMPELVCVCVYVWKYKTQFYRTYTIQTFKRINYKATITMKSDHNREKKKKKKSYAHKGEN